MLLQAYDFVHLYDHYHASCRSGGSDQWGNITAGIDSGSPHARRAALRDDLPAADQERRRKDGQDRVGRRLALGRTNQPLRFYQYWINVADEDAGTCLRFLTELGREEIEPLDEPAGTAREAREPTAAGRGIDSPGPRRVGSGVAQRATEMFYGAEIDR